jgi:catechol 2,3-dioxygenase-like lactoylglutathione lyase family enzyme
MGIAKLAHYSIRAEDLEASAKFYTEVMGFRLGYRPDFPFPGVWLYQSCDESEYGVVHIIGATPSGSVGLEQYLGERQARGSNDTGAFDHIAFSATDWRELRARLLELKVDFQERTVPSLELHQVFLQDPAGVTIELNYPASEATAASKSSSNAQ